MRNTVTPGSVSNRSLTEMSRRWTKDCPRAASADSNDSREGVAVYHDEVYSWTPHNSYRVLYRAGNLDKLHGTAAVDQKGGVYFTRSHEETPQLMHTKVGWRGSLQRFTTGPTPLTELPDRPTAIDVSDDGSRIILGFGRELKTWDAKAGLQPLATLDSPVESIAFLHDGSLGASTRSGYVCIPEGGTTPVSVTRKQMDDAEFLWAVAD